MRSHKKLYTFVAICTLALSTAFLSACNTVEGVGQDVESAGDAIEGAANDARD